MQGMNLINKDNLCIMDKNNIPGELRALGVESIKIEKSMAVRGIPSGDIMKIIAAIKNLED